jgi:hypothetical protein
MKTVLIIAGIIVALVLIVVIMMIPELRRYMRIRKM